MYRSSLLSSTIISSTTNNISQITTYYCYAHNSMYQHLKNMPLNPQEWPYEVTPNFKFFQQNPTFDLYYIPNLKYGMPRLVMQETQKE